MTRKLLIWLHYNTGRNTDFLEELEQIEHSFNEATKVSGKYCKCKNKGMAVNRFWKEWHCTYCLKLKKRVNGKIIY